MSCVSFGGRGWLERLRAAATDDQPVSTFRSPAATETKSRRVRLLAAAAEPRIRESAALSPLASEDVLRRLAEDEETSVRCCVARNGLTPPDVLHQLAADPAASVRGWVAANPSVAPATLHRLDADADATVRGVARWARGWVTGD